MNCTYTYKHQSQFIEMFGNVTESKVLSELIEVSYPGEWGKEPQGDGDVKVLRTTNFCNDGHLDYSDVVLRNIEQHKIEKKRLKKYDIILERSGGTKDNPVGRVVLFDSDDVYLFNNFTQLLRPSNSVNPFYLFYYLYSNYNADKASMRAMASQTTGIQNLSMSDYMAKSIPTPSITEQNQFEQLYRQADKSKFDGFKSQFIEMFGDPMTNTKSWAEYGYISNYTQIVLGSTPNSKNSSYWDGEIKWITPAEMTEESYYIYDTERHLSEDGLKAANLMLLPCRTVLFSTRAPIGKVGLVGSPMYCNQGFKNFICGNKLNPVYLYYSLIFKREYLVSLGTGTTFKELSKKAVENLKIAVPPLILQNKFEAIYQQADKSKYYELN